MVKFKDFSRPLSVIHVLFKANLIFNDFSRHSCIFKYFSSLCEPCYLFHKSVLFQSHYDTAETKLWRVRSRFETPMMTLRLYWEEFYLIKFVNMFKIFAKHLWLMRGNYESLWLFQDRFENQSRMQVTSCCKLSHPREWKRSFNI